VLGVPYSVFFRNQIVMDTQKLIAGVEIMHDRVSAATSALETLKTHKQSVEQALHHAAQE
jgi:hypothetical protein